MIKILIGMPPTHSKRSHSASRIDPLKNKRAVSPEYQNTTNTSAKRSRNTKMSANDIEDLRLLILSSSSKVEDKIDSSQSTLETKLNDLATCVNTDISTLKESVDDFKANVTSELGTIKQHIDNHSHRLDNAEDDIQRLQRNQELRLVGFQHKDNENLSELFGTIANVIGFNNNNNSLVPIMSRIYVRDKVTNQMIPTKTIMIQFALHKQKQMFYSQYLNCLPLDPKKFGMNENNRIIIGENLTKKNAQIFKKAQSFKREKKLAQVFTENGLVKVKLERSKQTPTHTIKSIIELESLVAQTQAQQLKSTNTSDVQPTHSNMNTIQQPNETMMTEVLKQTNEVKKTNTYHLNQKQSKYDIRSLTSL